MKFGVERKVWEGDKTKTIKRDWGEMKKNCTDPIYRKSQISMDRKVSRFKMPRNSYRATIEDLSRGVHSKRGSMDREAIVHLSSIQKLPRWIE